jgi:hypothetical protein
MGQNVNLTGHCFGFFFSLMEMHEAHKEAITVKDKIKR